MSNNLPVIGVMVLNRDGRSWLAPLYDSLRRQGYPALRIYLVDNASTDDSVELTQAGYPEVNIIRFSENLGYCMAYNRAMPRAFADGCEWLVWANNDVLLEGGCLLELGRAAADNPRAGILGPAFLAWDSDEPNYYIKGNYPAAIELMRQANPPLLDVDWVEGSFLMVRDRCVAEVGWLDPFLYFYWEEADYCRRARRRGWRVVLVPRALARHYAGGWSSGSRKNADSVNSLKARNQYIYVLADPDRSFAGNVARGARLFLVLLRAAVHESPAAVLREIRTLTRVIGELPGIRHKWRRDRHGGDPEPMTPAFAGVTMENIPAQAERANERRPGSQAGR